MMMMMMMIIYGMVDRRKVLIISSRDHSRFSSSQISVRVRARFEPAQNLSLDFVEWSFEVVITTALRIHKCWLIFLTCLHEQVSSINSIKRGHVWFTKLYEKWNAYFFTKTIYGKCELLFDLRQTFFTTTISNNG